MSTSTALRSITTLIAVLLSVQHIKAQQPADCEDIKVEAKVVNSTSGQNNGSIQLLFSNQPHTRYRVFLINHGADQAKLELTTKKADRLKRGAYEFIIIDTRQKGCFRDFSIQVNEKR